MGNTWKLVCSSNLKILQLSNYNITKIFKSGLNHI